MKNIRRFVICLLIFAMILPIVACKEKNQMAGEDPDTTVTPPPVVNPTPQTKLPEIVMMSESAELTVGDTLSLAGAYVLKNCTDSTVTYATSDPLIATVDVNGIVRAISEGEATITLSVENGSCMAGFQLTVKKNEEPDDPPVDPPKPSVELSFTEVVLIVGESKQIAYTLLNCDENTIVSFASSSGAAKVNENGLIEAVSEGSCVITVTVTGGAYATVTVTVKEPEVVSSVPYYEPTFDPGVTYTSWSAKNVKHVFFHNLIAFEDKTGHFDSDCLYVSEFKAMLEQMYQPENGYTDVYYKGAKEKKTEYASSIAFNRRISSICKDYYLHTPKINNELINRKSLTPQIKKARNKIMTALLQGEDMENYYKGTSPEATIFRAVFYLSYILL